MRRTVIPAARCRNLTPRKDLVSRAVESGGVERGDYLFTVKRFDVISKRRSRRDKAS